MESQVEMILIGGPTVLLALDKFRFLTDPTFDPPIEFSRAGATYSKLEPPALDVEHVLPVDAVLLSHDQHADNLDDAGLAFLDNFPRVFSTPAAASRLKRVEGLTTWTFVEASLQQELEDPRSILIYEVWPESPNCFMKNQLTKEYGRPLNKR